MSWRTHLVGVIVAVKLGSRDDYGTTRVEAAVMDLGYRGVAIIQGSCLAEALAAAAEDSLWGVGAGVDDLGRDGLGPEFCVPFNGRTIYPAGEYRDGWSTPEEAISELRGEAAKQGQRLVCLNPRAVLVGSATKLRSPRALIRVCAAGVSSWQVHKGKAVKEYLAGAKRDLDGLSVIPVDVWTRLHQRTLDVDFTRGDAALKYIQRAGCSYREHGGSDLADRIYAITQGPADMPKAPAAQPAQPMLKQSLGLRIAIRTAELNKLHHKDRMEADDD
jgi:hypothetical protein